MKRTMVEGRTSVPGPGALPSLYMLLLCVVLPAGTSSGAEPQGAPGGTRRSDNVFLVLVDGARWQEVFTGADSALMNKNPGGVEDTAGLKEKFWRGSEEERRRALMPFVWDTIAGKGQLIGNKSRGSMAKVTNHYRFSYPGYSEMITGYADSSINTNDKIPNRNISVFEWLNGKDRYRGRVAVFGAWDVVAWIVNRDRCGFFVNVGIDPVSAGTVSAEQSLLNRLKEDLHHPWGTEPYDAITFYSALEYVRTHHPAVFWLTFGETDEFAHEGRYDYYLEALHRTDGFLRKLWETLQSIPAYRGKTTLIVCVDHGRGSGPEDWKNHGVKVKEAEDIWMGIVGPDTLPSGEWRNTGVVTLSQIAATLAVALGEDYNAAQPKAGLPLPGVVRQGK